MPDAFGNPTPQEILAKISAERDAALSGAMTPYERRNAQLFAMGRLLSAGMDPRLVKAKEIDGALRKSSGLTRTEDETAIDFEIRRGRQMFDDIALVDPTTAADISAKLVELEAERAQQNRLKAEDARDEERFKWERQEQERAVKEGKGWDITNGLFYELDPRTGKLTDVTTSVNDVTHDMTVSEVRERGNLLLSADDVAAQQLNSSEANFKLLGSDFAGQRQVVSSALESTLVARDLAKLYVEASEEGVNPTTKADTVMRAGGSIINAVNEARKAAGLLPAPEIGSPEFAEDQSKIDRMLAERGVQSAVPTAMLTLFTYAVAKSYDPRVTEQDYRNFSTLLGGNSGSPAQIMATMNQLLMGRHEHITRDIGTITANLEEAPEGSLGRMQGKALRDALNELASAKQEFTEPFEHLMEMHNAKIPGTHRTGANQPPSNVVRAGGQTFTLRPGSN